MQTANRILEILYDRAGQYVWQDDLAASAKTTAAGVEKVLAALTQRGHRFERSPAAGVRLLRPTALDAHLVERALPVASIGKHVICFGEVDSTNDVAAASARQARGQALVVTAESQRAGRGRFGRVWVSPPGANILVSVLLPSQGAPLPPEALTIAAGLAVAQGIEDATGLAVGLEWPNDVVLDGAKLAGVIVEVKGAALPDASPTVIGFGINVNAKPPAEAVDRPVACLAEVAGEASLERIEILRAVLVRLDGCVVQIGLGRFEDLHRQWRQRCVMLDQYIRVRHAGKEIAGRVVDVDPLAGLVLEVEGRVHLRLASAATTVIG
jgi:BirA family biotin operon repressor/biotin-[acetyl-CoA-carboxylase] ligase